MKRDSACVLLVRVRSIALGALAFALAACGGTPAVVATSSPTQTPTATPVAATNAGAWTVSDRSKATVSVREQLVGVNLPSDALLVTSGGTGSFTLNADGTFSPDSKISFDLTTLVSDNRDRDNFIRQDTLQVRQFPKAEFVPTKATGLALPLATSGELTFKIAGQMTIHGTTKEVTFDVKATRTGADLVATATANPTWKFSDFGMRMPSVPFRVVSVNDEIRLVVSLVATGPNT